jgi:hypothetical protein
VDVAGGLVVGPVVRSPTDRLRVVSEFGAKSTYPMPMTRARATRIGMALQRASL